MAEEQARQLLSEADRKLSKKAFFLGLFTNRNRTEEAIECYQKAGNLFKLSQNWEQAGAAFLRAAELHDQSNQMGAANNYVSASKCLCKYNSDKAINCLLTAIEIYTDLGRFVIAAKLHNSIADLYENELRYEDAIQHYQQAADYFKVDENYSHAKKCLIKVAEHSCVHFEQYERAIQIYNELVLFDLKSPILKYNVKENITRAVLCHLCVDFLNAQHALNFYLEQYPAFDLTREYKFLCKIIEQIEVGDNDSYTKIVQEFDSISRLDCWFTKMLLRIKKMINESPNIL